MRGRAVHRPTRCILRMTFRVAGGHNGDTDCGITLLLYCERIIDSPLPWECVGLGAGISGRRAGGSQGGIVVIKHCSECGVPISTQSMRWCASCYNKHRTDNLWAPKSQRGHMANTIRPMIRERDNYTCQICDLYVPPDVKDGSAWGRQYPPDLWVHHRNGNARDSAPSNLVLLCAKCHVKLHRNISFRLQHPEFCTLE